MRAPDFIAGLARALAREPVRVALTTLGIAVGTFAVATLLSLGAAVERAILGSLRSLGENLVIVTAEPPQASLAHGRSARDDVLSSRLTERDVAPLRNLPSVEAATAIVAAPCTAAVGTTAVTTNCVGIDPDYLDIARIAIEQGAEFSGAVATAPRAEAILGATVERRLFEVHGSLDAGVGIDASATPGGNSASRPPDAGSVAVMAANTVGADLQLAGRRVRVTGVARARGRGAGGADEDDFILVPKAFARQQLMARTNPGDADALFVLARVDAGVAVAASEIEGELAHRRRVDSVRGAISVNSLSNLMATSLKASNLLTLLLAGMAGISVLVGGVGIVNVMLTHVAERRLEIGLKLALGAAPGLIAAEFLAEAVVLATLGALLGLGAAQALTLLLTAARGFDVTLTPAAAGVSLVLALAVGILAGAWPADRAARLQPREILRDV